MKLFVAVLPVYATIINERIRNVFTAGMNDSEIITLFNNRDEAAIEAVKKQYGTYYRAVISGILELPEDREECSNDLLLALWNSIPPNSPENLKGYIGRTARNISVRLFRKNNAKMRNAVMTVALDELSDVLPSGRNPLDETVRKEISQAINDYLRSKKERDRDIFICRYYYYRSSVDISQSMGLGESHVRMILSRMRKELKAFLTERELI